MNLTLRGTAPLAVYSPPAATFTTHIGDYKGEGYYLIGDSFCVHVTTKPTKTQIKNIHKMLGWVWVDAT